MLSQVCTNKIVQAQTPFSIFIGRRGSQEFGKEREKSTGKAQRRNISHSVNRRFAFSLGRLCVHLDTIPSIHTKTNTATITHAKPFKTSSWNVGIQRLEVNVVYLVWKRRYDDHKVLLYAPPVVTQKHFRTTNVVLLSKFIADNLDTLNIKEQQETIWFELLIFFIESGFVTFMSCVRKYNIDDKFLLDVPHGFTTLNFNLTNLKLISGLLIQS